MILIKNGKIIENNDEEDKVEGTTFTVYLKNNHYKIITFDKTITSIKFIIEPLFLHQLGMGSAFLDGTVVYHNNLVGILYGGKAVCNHKTGLPFHQF